MDNIEYLQKYSGGVLIPEKKDVRNYKYESIARATIQKEDIDVSLKPKKIVVDCVRKEIEYNGFKSYTERPFGKLIRTIQLPLKANPESISCKYENGVLIIQIGKLEELNTIKKVRVE